MLRKAYPLWFARLDRETNPAHANSLPFQFDTVDALLRRDLGEGSQHAGAPAASTAGGDTTLISTLEELDQLVAALLDRDRYGGHIAALESTTQGVKLHQALHRRTASGGTSSLRARYCSTSALVRSLFHDCERQFLSAGSGTGMPEQLRGGASRGRRARGRRSPPGHAHRQPSGHLPSLLLEAAGFDDGPARHSASPGESTERPTGGSSGVGRRGLDFAGPDFTRDELLSAASRQQLYNAALKRVEARYGSRAAVFGAWLQVLIAVVTGIDAKSRTCAMSGVLSCCSLCDRGRSHGDTANEAYGRGRGLSTHFVVVPRTHVNKHPQLRGVSDAHVIRALWHHGGYITVHTDDSGQPHRRVVQHHARGHSTLHRQPQIFMLQHGS